MSDLRTIREIVQETDASPAIQRLLYDACVHHLYKLVDDGSIDIDIVSQATERPEEEIVRLMREAGYEPPVRYCELIEGQVDMVVPVEKMRRIVCCTVVQELSRYMIHHRLQKKELLLDDAWFTEERKEELRENMQEKFFAMQEKTFSRLCKQDIRYKNVEHVRSEAETEYTKMIKTLNEEQKTTIEKYLDSIESCAATCNDLYYLAGIIDAVNFLAMYGLVKQNRLNSSSEILVAEEKEKSIKKAVSILQRVGIADATIIREVQKEYGISDEIAEGYIRKRCYLVAKKRGAAGSIAVEVKRDKTVAALVTYLGYKMLNKDVEILTVSSKTMYGEYGPYHMVETEVEFIQKVLEM